jgi:hypothetical protein
MFSCRRTVNRAPLRAESRFPTMRCAGLRCRTGEEEGDKVAAECWGTAPPGEGRVAGKRGAVSGDGARELARRIAQQQQWQAADAVARGEQSPTDPDREELEDMADGLRMYARHAGERMCKRLVEGRWETEFVRE